MGICPKDLQIVEKVHNLGSIVPTDLQFFCVEYETYEVASESLSYVIQARDRYPSELYVKHLYFKIMKIKNGIIFVCVCSHVLYRMYRSQQTLFTM